MAGHVGLPGTTTRDTLNIKPDALPSPLPFPAQKPWSSGVHGASSGDSAAAAGSTVESPRLSVRAAERAPAILLASRSPRRRALLEAAGIAHFAAAPSFDDSDLLPGHIQSPSHWVMALAYLKAWAQADSFRDAPVVLGSDTACVMDDRLIGTPQTLAEARTMIAAFMNREHEVVTGVAIIDRRNGQPVRHLFADTANVRMGELNSETLEAYLATGGWHGKAGGYNLLERIDAGWPLTYQGDPTTIMGLPMKCLVNRLNSIFG